MRRVTMAVLLAGTTAIASFGLAGCNKKTEQPAKMDQPAKTEQPVEAAKPPMDHPAH